MLPDGVACRLSNDVPRGCRLCSVVLLADSVCAIAVFVVESAGGVMVPSVSSCGSVLAASCASCRSWSRFEMNSCTSCRIGSSSRLLWAIVVVCVSGLVVGSCGWLCYGEDDEDSVTLDRL